MIIKNIITHIKFNVIDLLFELRIYKMFNNNNNNGINSQNIWDQMALFNQYTLRNILNGRNDLGTPELRAAVATMNEEQKDNAMIFLECNTEELAGLPDGWGIQAVANVCDLLDYLPTIEPKQG